MIFPWHDRWRHHPIFKPTIRSYFPGFGTGVALFAGYVVVEAIYKKMNKKASHDEPHAHCSFLFFFF
jgi:hypothetical protein